jgi:hypothetical protein
MVDRRAGVIRVSMRPLAHQRFQPFGGQGIRESGDRQDGHGFSPGSGG